MPNEKTDSFQCGPFEVARNPDVRTFVDKLNRLREAVDQCRIQPGVGYTINRGTNGTVLSIKTGSGGGSPPPEAHPFKVEWLRDGDTYAFTVERESYLFPHGRVPDAGEKIGTPVKDLSEPVHITLRIGLNIQYEGGDPVTETELVAKLESERLPLVEPQSGGEQTHANVILATVATSGTVVQAARSNLALAWTSYAGYSALIPVHAP